MTQTHDLTDSRLSQQGFLYLISVELEEAGASTWDFRSRGLTVEVDGQTTINHEGEMVITAIDPEDDSDLVSLPFQPHAVRVNLERWVREQLDDDTIRCEASTGQGIWTISFVINN